MRNVQCLPQSVWLVLLICTPLRAEVPSVDRGRLLYENHCLTCHESQVHIRQNHKAHAFDEVVREVARWSQTLGVDWHDPEIQDVSQYLYQTFYTQKK